MYIKLLNLKGLKEFSIAAILLAAGNTVSAQGNQAASDDVRDDQLQLTVPERKVEEPRWYLSFDNDFFAPKNRDQDYTYGVNLAYASSKVSDWWPSKWLYSIDRTLGLGGRAATRGHAVEIGFYGFTPANVEDEGLTVDDRPYSSLVYSSITAERLNWSDKSIVRTQFTVGALGLSVVGDLQNVTHRITGGQEAMGWEHQISNGGEPTFRYSVARSKLLTGADSPVEARHTMSASVGYITEAAWSFGLRTGTIRTPWHSFKPEVKNYAESTASKLSNVPEQYFWFGGAVKIRGYNAFLQGQFRDSELTYDASELRPVVYELWAGYTHEFASGFHINYALRGQSSEIKDGAADRSMLWGGIIIGKNAG